MAIVISFKPTSSAPSPALAYPIERGEGHVPDARVGSEASDGRAEVVSGGCVVRIKLKNKIIVIITISAVKFG